MDELRQTFAEIAEATIKEVQQVTYIHTYIHTYTVLPIYLPTHLPTYLRPDHHHGICPHVGEGAHRVKV